MRKLPIRSQALRFVALVALCGCPLADADRMRDFYPLPVPPVLQPTSRDAAGVHYEITQRQGVQAVTPGFPATQIEGFEGIWPGPTIVARRGETAFVTQINQLAHPVTVHNHGHQVAAVSDGHPVDFIQPGGRKTYEYPNNQNAGTYWLHDHTMSATGPNVMRGLSSFYIIKDALWDSLNLPTGEFDVPLLLQDRYLDVDQQLIYGVAGIGNIAVVNGVRTPRFAVAARKYLFRLLNGSDSRGYRVELAPLSEFGRDAPRVPFAVVSSDGGLLPHPVWRQDLLIMAAERFGIIVDFSKYPIGTSIRMRNRNPVNAVLANGTPVSAVPELMTFDVVRSAEDTSTVPNDMLPIVRFDGETAAVNRNITLERQDGLPDMARWTINGREFDPTRSEFRPKLGDLEKWTITNLTTVVHVFHLHLVQFQVLNAQGPPLPEQEGWKDTVAIPPFAQVQIAMRWEGYPGYYMMHCHFLDHEDRAMMAQIEVVR